MRVFVVALCLVLAGCATTTEEAVIDPGQGPVSILIDPAKAAPDAIAAADAEFGRALLDRLGDGNIVCSPYSIATALQMTLLGARGQTATEMVDTLRLARLSPDELASTAAVLRQALQPLSKHLSIANALWPARGLPLDAGYVRAVEEGFGPKTTPLDFAGDPEGARKTINAAIAAATRDKIPELLPSGTVDINTIMVLTNAVYLKAPWALPFDQNGTRDGSFTRPDGTTVTVPMMHQELFNYGYRDADGYRVIRLPYQGNRLAMSIVLPDGPLSELHGYDLHGTGPTPMRLAMPRFKFRTQTSVVEMLQAMGMRTAFGPGADFSGMTPVGAEISDVVHQAMIDVDEKGTEAAAATAVAMLSSAQPTPQLDIAVDRPFLFAITDTDTGTPLFLGRVTDPTQG